MENGYVVLGLARLPGCNAGGDGTIDRLLIEAQISAGRVCLGIALLPEMPLLKRLLEEILLERHLSEFGEACREIERRYHGPFARAVLAAVRNLAAAPQFPSCASMTAHAPASGTGT